MSCFSTSYTFYTTGILSHIWQYEMTTVGCADFPSPNPLWKYWNCQSKFPFLFPSPTSAFQRTLALQHLLRDFGLPGLWDGDDQPEVVRQESTLWETRSMFPAQHWEMEKRAGSRVPWLWTPRRWFYVLYAGRFGEWKTLERVRYKK